MAERPDLPGSEQVESFEQSLQAITAYDMVFWETQRIGHLYPDSEHHRALQAVAETAIDIHRADEVKIAQTKKTHLIDTSDEHETSIRHQAHISQGQEAELRAQLEVLERSPQVLYGGYLSEATPEERIVIGQILDRKQQRLIDQLDDQLTRQLLLKAARSRLQHATKLPIQETPPKWRYARAPAKATPEEEQPVVDRQLLAQYEKVVGCILKERGGMQREADLVRDVYPDLYMSDRPAAYRLFMTAYERFAELPAQTVLDKSGFYLQRGKLYDGSLTASQPCGEALETVYQVLRSGHPMVYSQGNVRQRLSFGSEQQFVIWDRVHPHPPKVTKPSRRKS